MSPLKFAASRVSPVLIYVLIISAAVSIARSRLQKAAAEAKPAFPVAAEPNATRPFFSLSTTRTFGTNENPRIWLDHRLLDSLDFRVYRINDPERFFAQLSDPHQVGDDEKTQLASQLSRRPSLLERVRAVKLWAYLGVRNYFREQLQQDTRYTFNQKFRATETTRRVPLNVADFARVPLLNPNQLVTTWREPLPALENEFDRRMIPLGKRESGVYLVEAVSGDLRAYTVVVVTDLALVEKASASGDFLVYAVDRKSGEPRADARVEVMKEHRTLASGRTDKDGLFRAKLPTGEGPDAEGETGSDGVTILASQRDNFAIADLEGLYFYFGENENVQGYIYTDRPVYRPAHKVFFKGILRAIDEEGQYRPLKSDTITVTVKDANDARLFEQQLHLSKHGTFNSELTLPEEAALGTYRIEAETDEGSAEGSFDVAEYKKPEYKVNVTTPKRFAPEGSKSRFDIDARYFFGAPLAGAEVKYYVYRTRYYPYFSGEEVQEDADQDAEFSQYDNYYTDMTLDGEGKLDASGHLSVEFDVPASREDDIWDFQYRLEAQVTDSSRRSINGSANVVATRGNVVARATPDRFVYNKGETAKITISTTDYEGRPVAAKLSLKFLGRSWEKVEKKEHEDDPNYTIREYELSSTDIATDREGRAFFNFPVNETGNISLKTVVHDEGKQFASVGGFIWVASSDQQWSDSAYYRESFGSIKLVPDKKSYRAGETAHVLAILPDDRANLLVTTERSTIMSAWQVKAAGQTVIIDVPIEANYAPTAFVSVTFVRDGDMYTSDQRLTVPARDKLLNLEIISNKQEYKPRETASYTVLARDADGAPVPDAEVSLGVVDEAIYSVSPDFSGNIRQQFYGAHYNEVGTHLSISYSFTGFAGEKPVDLARTKPSYQLADFKNESDMVQPLIRKEFKDTAYWEPSAITGADGRATVKFRLPDNLTTWRATARAVTPDTKVGVARQKVISRKDVILRLETPRFMTQGDTVTLSGIVHNYLKQDMSTQISISVSGGAQLLSPPQQTVTIPRQGEHRIDWQISAPQTGEITLLAKALTNTESDAVELALAVVPRGLHETKAQNWTTTDESGEQEFSLDLPANTDLNSRQLRVEVSPSITGTLFGALDYLTTFPYGCTEQTMSSFLPNVIVSQTVKEFKTASIRNPDELKQKVERGRNRLYAFQHDDGGWGWWKDDASDPFMTAYVVDGLTLAKQAGYEIDDARVARGREKLESMLTIQEFKDNDTRALMVYALAESGGADSNHIEKLFAERQHLQPYGRALLALTLSLRKDRRAGEVATEIERSAVMDQNVAYWQSERTPMLDFADYDQTEGTALSLKALARIKPESELLLRAARWLVSKDREQGYYWQSTKDTAFAIYGLIDYVKVSHELTPEYDVEVYVNGETVLTQHVTDATALGTLAIGRKGASVGETNHVRIVKRGKGALYVSSSVDYYTGEENVAPRGSADLSVSREYLRLQVAQVGYQLKWTTVPLTGEIKSGDLIVVKLHVTGRKARHLMLEDPIPSGAEQLESVGNLNLDHEDLNWSDWYSAREFRDRRTVFFMDRFDGDATLRYAMRVQIPGEFVVAPARAELMYRPAVNTNSASQHFSFRDR